MLEYGIVLLKKEYSFVNELPTKQKKRAEIGSLF